MQVRIMILVSIYSGGKFTFTELYFIALCYPAYNEHLILYLSINRLFERDLFNSW